jgi:4-diphosphocytidyl-2-C-methyl-D-erythritol kinase
MVSTAWVYAGLKLTKKTMSTRIDRLRDRPWLLGDLLFNDLEHVTLPAYPRLGEIKDWLVAHQALGALMSGSGPTVFGVFREPGTAGRVVQLAREVWSDCWVAATEVLEAPEKSA